MARSDKRRHSGTTRKPAAIDHKPLPKGSNNVPAAEPVAMIQVEETKSKLAKKEKLKSSPELKDKGNKASSSNEKFMGTADKETIIDNDQMTSQQHSTKNTFTNSNRSAKSSNGLLSGVAGGVIAIALAGALQLSGIIPPLTNVNQAAISDNNISQIVSNNVKKEISILKADLQLLKEQGQKQVSSTSNVISNIDKNLIEGATKTAEDARNIADKAQEMLNEAQQKAGSFVDQLEEVRSDIKSLKENFVQNNAAAMNDANPQILALEGKLNALDENLTQLKNSFEQQLNGFKEEFDKAKQIEYLANKNRATIEQNTQKIASIALEVKRVSDPSITHAQSMATLIAANALKSAVDRGGSYVNELKTFESLAPKGISLDELKKYSTTGIISNTILSEEFSKIADAIAATENQVSNDANWGTKAWSYAKSFVAIRPIGNVDGDNAGAIAARMEVAIKAGDYTRAMNEWQNLPQAAKDISSNFMSKLKVRNEIDQLLAKLVNLTINPNAIANKQAAPNVLDENTPHQGETQP